MNDLPSQPQACVLQDIPCIRCGYNLRTLPTDGHCPECSAPVSDSLRIDSLYFADPRWLRRLHQGTTILIIALVAWLSVALCAFVLFLFVVTQTMIPVATIIVHVLLVTLILLAFSAVFLLLVNEPRIESKSRPQIQLEVARAAVAGAALLLVLDRFLSLVDSSPWTVIALAFPVRAVLMAFAFTIAGLQLQRVAMRAGSAKLAAWTSILIFAIVFLAAQQLVGGLIVLYQELSGRSTDLFPHLNTVVMITALATGCLAFPLMILYRRMLSSILRGSIAKRSDQNAHHESMAAE